MEVKQRQKDGNLPNPNALEKKAFGIGNAGLVMSILRSKMYSNPIRVVCQEIISNARDAHREVDKHDVPVEVMLPTSGSPFFKVQDFGPGISPERINDIYIMYGNSTKRGDNEQTGGWGLGAKTPWAYTNSFKIETIVYDDKHGCRVKRWYRAFLDNSENGLLELSNEETTEEEIGTKISVPVKSMDFGRFFTWTMESVKYWGFVGDPVPKIIEDGKAIDADRWSKFAIDNDETIFSGLNWFITDKGNESSGNYVAKAIVDGIPYDINFSSLSLHHYTTSSEEDGLAYFNNTCLRLIFDTGEVSLSASREALDYNQKTIDTIKTKLLDVRSDLNSILVDKVSKSSNLWNAEAVFINFKEMLEKGSVFIDHVKITGSWTNKFNIKRSLASKVLHKRDEITNDKRLQHFVSMHSCVKDSNGSITIAVAKELKPSLDVDLYLNDLGQPRPNMGRLQSAFEMFPDKKEILVVSPRGNLDAVEAIKELDRHIHINDMFSYALSYFEAKRKRRSKSNKPRTAGNKTVRKRNTTCIEEVWCDDSLGNLVRKKVDIRLGSGYFVLAKHYDLYLQRAKYNYILSQDLSSVAKKLVIDIIRITPSLAKRLGPGWQPLENKLEEEIKNRNLQQSDYDCFAEFVVLRRGAVCNLTLDNDLWASLVNDVKSNCLLRQYIDHIEYVKQKRNTYDFAFIKTLLEMLNRPITTNMESLDESKFSKLGEAVENMYKLLPQLKLPIRRIDEWDKDVKIGFIQHLLQYVNTIYAPQIQV